jgi:hypothetical protein
LWLLVVVLVLVFMEAVEVLVASVLEQDYL